MNPPEAVKWYRKAAEQGHEYGQNNLGFCYITGEGVVKNDLEGYKWVLLAAAKGAKKAKENASIVERRLSPEQRAEAQRMATEWQADFEKKQEKVE